MDFLKILGSVTGGNTGNSLNNLKNLIAAQLNPVSGVKPAGSVTDSALAELSLLFQALYGALLDKNIITQDDFKKKFDELDMRDGVKDGK